MEHRAESLSRTHPAEGSSELHDPDQIRDLPLNIDTSQTSFTTPHGNEFHAVGSDYAACVLLTRQVKLRNGISLGENEETAVQHENIEDAHWHTVRVGTEPISGPSFRERVVAIIQNKFPFSRAAEIKPSSPSE